MVAIALALVAGTVLLHWLPSLPPVWLTGCLPLCLLLFVWQGTRLLAVFILGFLLSVWQADRVMQPALATAFEGKTLLIEGRVLATPARIGQRQLRFPFYVERINGGSDWSSFHGKVRLSLYASTPLLSAGERWQLAVRLKRPHGFANPGGFDYEGWLFQQGFRATGYVRSRDEGNHFLAATAVNPVNAFRSRLSATLDTSMTAKPSLAIVLALTVGDRSDLSKQQWAVLRATGTSHLMAISGLHISLVAGLVFTLTRLLWLRCAVLVERYPARKAAALAAMFAALGYAALAGFSIPTRRAVIMVAVYMLSIMLSRGASFTHAIALAMVCTLMLDPLSILAPGWWLSFWAVITIAYCISGRYGQRSFTQKWLSMHALLALAMTPLLLLFFQQASIIAPFANSIAVPYVSLLVVPVALLGTLVFSVADSAGTGLLYFAAWLMDGLWPLLTWLAEFEQRLWHPQRPLIWTLFPALLGIAVLCLPRGIPGRWLSILLILPLLLLKPLRPAWGEAQVTLLDVGQGLSTVVQTRSHTLVYDAGPRFSDRFDTGDAVVTPFLRHAGIHKLDTLVVSHGDNDHIGGVASLLADYPADVILTSVPGHAVLPAARRCSSEQRWDWDGVSFVIMHPGNEQRLTGNDASCVLRIESAGGHSVLLTGDIEARAEQSLLQSQQSLAATVLVVPHHGSKTSSTQTFINAVSPAIALFPAGFRNRYGFPKAAVMARYNAANVKSYQTGLGGALALTLSSGREKPVIRRYRDAGRRFWQYENKP